jgi:hypothetical protein
VNDILGRLTDGPNTTVLGWKEGVEGLLLTGCTPGRRRKQAYHHPGLAIGIDNVGLVSGSFSVHN